MSTNLPVSPDFIQEYVCHCLQPYSAHFDHDGCFNYICSAYTPLASQRVLDQFIGNDENNNPNIHLYDEFDIHPSDTGGYKICKRVSKNKNNPRGIQLWAYFHSEQSAQRMMTLINQRQRELEYRG